MSAEVKYDDSSDSDCFIVEEIKPVVRKAPIRISNSIFYSERNDGSTKKLRKSSADSNERNTKKKQTYLTDNGISVKGKLSDPDVNNKIRKTSLGGCKDVFSEGRKSNIKQNKSQQNRSVELQNSQNSKSPKTASPSEKHASAEKIQLSPGISRKRKRFIFNEYTPVPNSSKKSTKKRLMFDEFEKTTNPVEANDAAVQNTIKGGFGNSKLLSFLLKEMVKTEMKQHFTLISDRDKEILETFFKLNESACKIFVRMLGRKKSWHRVCDIVYKDIGDDLESEFETLNRENYVDVNIDDQDLKIQMDLLKKPEVFGLCKAFNVSFKFIDSNRKEDLISLLIEDCQKQKSALDMFRGKNSTMRMDKLKSEVRKCLGMCIKINSPTFSAFHKILILSSFPHYFEEEEHRFSKELLTRSQVHKNIIRFPQYKVTAAVVFETQADFEEYRKALLLQDSYDIAFSNKNYEKFVCVCLRAREEFEKLLKNNEYVERFLKLQPFLRKFSAGTIYARILTGYCTTFKKKVENSEVRTTAELLLNQNLFLARKKAEWYEILAKTYKNQKENNLAAEVIIKALGDPQISEVQKLALQLRGQMILKIQSCGVSDGSIRVVLSGLCASTVKEPLSTEIKGKALGENESGHRCVYIEESQNGKRYMTVEERAISHYKLNGFTRGYHTEGMIIQTIYFLLFYDIIYGLSPAGVFLSPYQEAPLDFNSSTFYESRKEEIDLLLSDMSGWDESELEARIKDSYYRNCGTTCLITWSDEFTPELFCELVKCITVPRLVLIVQRFSRNFRQVRAGFPDLTLWNPETNKCKFVEVKSPSDKLSPGQRVWLDFLRSIGLDCEVCNVKNVSGKNLK